MKLWGISDLHLSFSVDKPMEIFGDLWVKHHERLRESWLGSVQEDDLVLMPGDLSWGMKYGEALDDLNWIGELPGRKFVCRGNHDYWWGSLAKARSNLPQGMEPVQNSAVDAGPVLIASSRGWSVPQWEGFDSSTDEKYYLRELKRMELALEAVQGLKKEDKPLVYMMHYPPVIDGESTSFSDLLCAAGVSVCAYGHLHCTGGWGNDLDIDLNGVAFRLVSADYLEFKPRLLMEFDQEAGRR